MVKELLTAVTCCVGVITTSSYNLPSQCDYSNKYHIESKVFELTNTTQTIYSNTESLKKENIQLCEEYSVKSLEGIFGKMSNFTKEENEYFWRQIEAKSTIIEDIELI